MGVPVAAPVTVPVTEPVTEPVMESVTGTDPDPDREAETGPRKGPGTVEEGAQQRGIEEETSGTGTHVVPATSGTAIITATTTGIRAASAAPWAPAELEGQTRVLT